MPELSLTPRHLCDLELITNGAFAPLPGFLNERDYNSVVKNMRLASGELWPIPVTLDISRAQAENLTPGQTLDLRDPEGVLLATMFVEDIYEPDRELEAEAVFGTLDRNHPGVAHLL